MAIAGIVLGLLGSIPACASLIVTVGSTTVNANSMLDSFDVTLMNTGSGAVTISATDIEVTTTNTAITFTDATVGTAVSYIFAGNSLLGPDILGNTGSAPPSLSAGDVWGGGGAGFVLNSGATVGLAHVIFSVGNTSGSASVTLSPLTSLSDQNGMLLALDTTSVGTITINGSATPEPSTLIPMTIVLIAAGVRWRRMNPSLDPS